MAIEFDCPLCGSVIRVPDNASGKKGSCPACHAKLLVPTIEALQAGTAVEPAGAIPESLAPQKNALPKNASVEKPQRPKPKRADVPAVKAPVSAKPKPARKSREVEPEIDPALAPLLNMAPLGGDYDDHDGGPNLAVFNPLADELDAAAGFAPVPKPKKRAAVPAPRKVVERERVNQREIEPIADFELKPEPELVIEPRPERVVEPEPVVFPMPTQFDGGEGPSLDFTVPSASTGRASAASQKFQRKAANQGRSKMGMWFGLVCGVVLLGGLTFWAMQNDTTLGGERPAFLVEKGVELEPRSPDRSLIDADDDVLKLVLKNFKKNPARMPSEYVEVEFRNESDEFAVAVRPGSLAALFRFPIDRELAKYYEQNRRSLDAKRMAKLKPALKSFFQKWDIAIRNREPKEADDRSFRNRVGLSSCVRGLGYNLAARVGEDTYPCVYEDDQNLYFALPRKTIEFDVVGRLALEDGQKSMFSGTYHCKVGGRPTAVKSKAAKDAEPAMTESSESSEGEAMEPAKK